MAVVAAATPEELAQVAALRRRYGALTIVQFDATSWDPGAARSDGDAAPRNDGILHVTGERSFAATWNASVRLARRSGDQIGIRSRSQTPESDLDRWARRARMRS